MPNSCASSELGTPLPGRAYYKGKGCHCFTARNQGNPSPATLHKFSYWPEGGSLKPLRKSIVRRRESHEITLSPYAHHACNSFSSRSWLAPANDEQEHDAATAAR